MTVKILYRQAEVIEGEWQLLATVSSARAAADELGSWQWTSPSHGDLVRLVWPKSEKKKQSRRKDAANVGAERSKEALFVFDSAKSGFVEVEAGDNKIGWVEIWEGANDDAAAMIYSCRRVDRRRVALAVCDCAETTLPLVTPGEYRPRNAIETTRAWARGDAAIQDASQSLRASIGVAEPVENALYFACASCSNAARVATTTRSFSPMASNASAVDSIHDVYTAHLYTYGPAYAEEKLRDMASMIRRHIPLSVLACALVGARDPLPLPRVNPKISRRR